MPLFNRGKFLTDLVINLVEDHARLASLEWRYEKTHILRKVCSIAAAALLTLTAYVLAQVALFWEVFRLWRSVVGVSLGLAAINAGSAALLVWGLFRKDPRAGKPFQGTTEEWKETTLWIRELFS